MLGSSTSFWLCYLWRNVSVFSPFLRLCNAFLIFHGFSSGFSSPLWKCCGPHCLQLRCLRTGICPASAKCVEVGVLPWGFQRSNSGPLTFSPQPQTKYFEFILPLEDAGLNMRALLSYLIPTELIFYRKYWLSKL